MIKNKNINIIYKDDQIVVCEKPKGIPVSSTTDLGRLYLQDVFRFVETGVDKNGKVHGYFETTGYIPYCNDALRAKGNGYPDDFFKRRKLMEV